MQIVSAFKFTVMKNKIQIVFTNGAIYTVWKQWTIPHIQLHYQIGQEITYFVATSIMKLGTIDSLTIINSKIA
jgi:hypothetical protein